MKANRVCNGKGTLIRVRALAMTAAMLACLTAAARALECDTHNPCMTNGMCMPDGACQGTPVNGGSCDLLTDVLCQVNGQCVNGVCTGEPAPEGSGCGSGCGTCQPILPGVPFFTCMPKPEQVGKTCDPHLGACVTGTCRQFGIPPALTTTCIPAAKLCPDTDSDPCTTDGCNPATGMCEHSSAPPCIPECETCIPGTGCQPANLGTACSFQGECPVTSSCQSLQGRGFCLPGTPSSVAPTPTRTPTPTASPTLQVSTATPKPTDTSGPLTPTAPPPATATPGANVCGGDCDGNGAVTVNEIIILVNIALDIANASACPHGIPSGDTVNISLIIKAVGFALTTCPAA